MSAHKLVIKDAMRQIAGRVISALCGFLVIKIISPYLGTLRYGDYSTILKYFAIFSALADFGLYVIAVKKMGVIKDKINKGKLKKSAIEDVFGKFVGTRIIIMSIVYLIALLIAYFLPAYSSNQFLIRGLPIGMIFSAGFMTAGIIQLPLQIHRKMEQLSIGLILARLSQIAILSISVFLLFTRATQCTNDQFCLNNPHYTIFAFLIVLFSVFMSILTQGIYVWWRSNKYIKLRIRFDFKFIKDIIKSNFQYGISYFLSSFHTLIVLIFLSNFFPSSEGFSYTGIWALALALIEIFLIVPSALGNSMLHKVGNYSLKNKQKSFGNFFTLIFRIGGIVFMNFLLFNTEIISIISSKAYLGTGFMNPGSNTILPFLAIVLWLSFLKQVFNYLFVATDKQNLLLWINLIGVSCGIGIGLYLIPKYNIIGGIITQVFLEILFVLGAFFVANKQKIFIKIPRSKLFKIIGIIGIGSIVARFIIQYITSTNRIGTKLRYEIILIIIIPGILLLNKKNLPLPQKFKTTSMIIIGTTIINVTILLLTEYTHFKSFRIIATLINIIIINISLPTIKQLALGLTEEDSIEKTY